MKGKVAALMFFIVFICIAIFLLDFGRKRDKKEFLKFDSTTISGKLTLVDFARKQDVFKVNNSNEIYFFRSGLDYMPQLDRFFSHIAEKGDSIYKMAYSDTLFLIKENGNIYLFSFNKW